MKYYLIENKLTEERNYIARVLTTRKINQTGLIKKMLRKRNLVSKTDIVAVLNSYYEEIIQSIKDGYAINLPLLNIGYSITGIFESSENSFTKEKHKLHVKLNNGRLINEVLQNIPLKKVVSPNSTTEITHLVDVTSKTINTIITSEGLFELSGNRLKIAGTHATIGLYFVAENGNEIKVTLFSRNNFKNIIAQAPQLSPGSYAIRIKTQVTSNAQSFLKNVRITDSPFLVTVANK
ncbi:DNA-binding domain-containing protein [uncultured Tenacibaculum sp.]|uniref:DNA-binding domain-containing protein n=1 Tax=uncultured Tenacibaculum sp. TaxID=174713 RepID=UPI0026188094|nr:DNA-binding domain-containing protein [uncultured Tenacibaculum sp.]